MAQPQWVTPAGSLGTVPEGVFYSTPLLAIEPIVQLPITSVVKNNSSLILNFCLSSQYHLKPAAM